jgi:hypothetical protein
MSTFAGFLGIENLTLTTEMIIQQKKILRSFLRALNVSFFEDERWPDEKSKFLYDQLAVEVSSCPFILLIG